MQNDSELVLMLQFLNNSQTSRPIFFSLTLSLYFFTIFINLTLITTVCLDKTLHQPLYILVCNLCFNSICGSSSFYPKLLHDLLHESHVITHSGCLGQIFGIYFYVFCEFSCLTIMAFDRYLAICRPLQYQALMTVQRVMQLLLLIWSFSLLEAVVGIILTANLSICRRHIPKFFCTNWEFVKLSCSNTTINNIYGFVVIFLHVSQTGLIVVSYTQLVHASLKLHSSRRKFMQTCLPHLTTLLVFVCLQLFDSMYSRYGSSTQKVLQSILAAVFLVVPPLINPIIYGINLQPIRTRILHNFTFKPQHL